MELSIDTSSDLAGVAVSEGGGVVAELTWRTLANHTVELLPAVEVLLSRIKAGFQDINGIIVALGPGSFNGLRVGISAAKGLAASLGAPVAGISTLEVEAWPFAFFDGPVCAVHDAGRGELAAALFAGEGATLKRLQGDRLVRIEELIESTRCTTLFCGELPGKAELSLRSALGNLAVIPSTLARTRRLACLALLGMKRLSACPDNPAALQPIYLRQPNITRPKKEFTA
jgi:tRNA threonylcarbamoyl adenosine modification protein YeaZ